MRKGWCQSAERVLIADLSPPLLRGSKHEDGVMDRNTSALELYTEAAVPISRSKVLRHLGPLSSRGGRCGFVVESTWESRGHLCKTRGHSPSSRPSVRVVSDEKCFFSTCLVHIA